MKAYCTVTCPFSSCDHQQFWASVCPQRASEQLVSSHTYTPPTFPLSFTHCWLPWRSDPCWANLCSKGEGGVGAKCIVGRKGTEVTPAVYIQIKLGNNRDKHLKYNIQRDIERQILYEDFIIVNEFIKLTKYCIFILYIILLDIILNSNHDNLLVTE